MGRLLDFIASPYRVGFFRGHDYLSIEDIKKIRTTIESGANDHIVKEFENKFAKIVGEGDTVSFASGRMAFYALLRTLGVGEEDEIILTGFTCSVMINAVWRTGAIPVFSDVDPETFGSGPGNIKDKITKKTKVIVAQHSFGIPCKIEDIAEIAKNRGIFLIEDCAITLDSYSHGVTVGNFGDAAIFSTDHSKPMNTMIGGLLYTKNKSIMERVREDYRMLPDLEQDHQERLFRQFMIERLINLPENYRYSVMHSYLHRILKKTGLESRKYTFLEADYSCKKEEVYSYPAKMPAFLACIGLYEIDRWEKSKKQRKDLLKNYLKAAENSKLKEMIPKTYFDKGLDINPLRFVFCVPDRDKIFSAMSRIIDIQHIWFMEPIICARYGPSEMGYANGSCIVSEKIGKEIVNIPCALPDSWYQKMPGVFGEILSRYKKTIA